VSVNGWIEHANRHSPHIRKWENPKRRAMSYRRFRCAKCNEPGQFEKGDTCGSCANPRSRWSLPR